MKSELVGQAVQAVDKAGNVIFFGLAVYVDQGHVGIADPTGGTWEHPVEYTVVDPT
jgi:hypothetical protein